MIREPQTAFLQSEETREESTKGNPMPGTNNSVEETCHRTITDEDTCIYTMTSFQLLVLPKLTETTENLLAMNDAGEVLIAHREKATRSGEFPASGICGIRFHMLTGKRLPLRYSLTNSLTQAVRVTAMNHRGEVVGGYAGTVATESGHGLFWNAQGKMTALSGGIGIALNDAGQILTDDTHITDGQIFGDCAVGLAPNVRGKPVGVLRLANSASGGRASLARSINRYGAVVGPGLALWQPDDYGQGHIVERDNADNANTPFAGGDSPVITDEGIIVCLGTSPRPSTPEALRFHRWKAGVSSTAVPFRFPADSSFRRDGKLLSGTYRLTTVAANAHGDILLTIEGEYTINRKRQRETEAVLWRKDGSTQRLPHLRSGILLNNQGWVLGRTASGEAPYALLRPRG